MSPESASVAAPDLSSEALAKEDAWFDHASCAIIVRKTCRLPVQARWRVHDVAHDVVHEILRTSAGPGEGIGYQSAKLATPCGH